MFININNEAWMLEQVSSGRLSVSRSGEVLNNRTGRRIGAVGGKYPKITLFKEMVQGRRSVVNMLIHRLVWLVYKGAIPDGMQINHKDGNKLNPSLDNLELVTHSGNAKHAVRNGLLNILKGEQNGNARLTNAQAETIRQRLKNGEVCRRLAIEYGVSHPTIAYIRDRKTYVSL